MTVKPLHVGTINGKPVRFFRSPLTDWLPDMPWHAVSDFLAALEPPPEMLVVYYRNMQYIRTVKTMDGPVNVAPDFVAKSLVKDPFEFEEDDSEDGEMVSKNPAAFDYWNAIEEAVDELEGPPNPSDSNEIGGFGVRFMMDADKFFDLARYDPAAVRDDKAVTGKDGDIFSSAARADDNLDSLFPF